MTTAAATTKPPRQPLLDLDEALARLLETVRPLPAEQALSLDTFEALGHVLARDVCSLLDVPPADNSAMDGYALRCVDLGLAALPVSQRIAAGVVGMPLQAGTAARIFTGAPVPAGADAVVMQEQCEFDAGAGTVRVQAPVTPGQNIRRQGEDVRQGAVVLAAGARIDAAAMGLAASVGAARLWVMRRPRVALFSTGDELVMPGQPLRPGTIYNSNRYTLRGLLQGLGCEVTDLGIVPDQRDATRAALRQAALEHDLILTSGGVSVGEEDHLRPAVQAEGRLDLWQLAIKPGKPLAFGAVRRGGADPGNLRGPAGVDAAWFMGLPGNPVASLVTFHLLVRPVLLRLQGASALAPQAYALRADFDWPRVDKRREFLRARLNAEGGLDLFRNQSSGVLSSAVWADGLIELPPGQTIAAGQLVRFLPFAALMA